MNASRSSLDPRPALVASLQRQVERTLGVHPVEDERLVSTGSPLLDRLLPGGGLRRGSLVEYLSPAAGSGTGTLALAAARAACREEEGPSHRALVIVDRSRTFYPPAAAAWGIDLSQTILLQPADDAAELWALDQALRCPGVGAVFACCGKLDVRDFRRLQLAAESGGTLGVLVRPSRLRGQPTWADVQWEVRTKEQGRTKEEGRRTKEISRVGQASETSADPGGMGLHEMSKMTAGRRTFSPRGSALAGASLTHLTCWRLSVELVRCRGGPGGQIAELELDEAATVWRLAKTVQAARTSHEATHPLPASAELADPARPRRA